MRRRKKGGAGAWWWFGLMLRTELPRFSEGGIDLRHLFAAATGEVRLTAAFAADDGGDGLDDFAGLDLGLVVFTDVRHQGDVSAASGREDDHAAELAFEGVVQRHGVVGVHVAEVGDDEVAFGCGEEVFGFAAGFALLGGFEGFFELFLLREQLVELLLKVGGTLRTDFAGEELQEVGIGFGGVVGLHPGDGLNAAHASGDGSFGDEAEESDLAGVAGVSAAAEFHAPTIQRMGFAADLHDADVLGVFFAEELHDAAVRLRLGVGHFGPRNDVVGHDALVDEFFDVGELRGGQSGAVEVKGELVRRDVGAFLGGVLADDLMKRPMQDVRDGVVSLDGVTACGIDGHADAGADGGCVFAFDEVQPGVADFRRAGDGEGVRADDDLAAVADLAAHFGVANAGVEHHRRLVLHGDDFEHLGVGFERVVTNELGGVLGFDLADGDDLLVLLTGITSALFLLVHKLVKACGVHGEAAFAGEELGEVDGETEGVVELEGKSATESSV